MDPTRFLDIKGILERLPHRYPFLLVDRVTEITETGIRGYKNVSVNEPWAMGHFPGQPVYPGVLSTESLVQLAAIKAMQSYTMGVGDIMVYMGIDKCKFRNPVYPGDRLDLEIEILKTKKSYFKAAGKGFVDGVLCIQLELMAGIKRA
jgi:3-hydroxyacyl-[acyl-carrier-protein] dehydratase